MRQPPPLKKVNIRDLKNVKPDDAVWPKFEVVDDNGEVLATVGEDPEALKSVRWTMPSAYIPLEDL